MAPNGAVDGRMEAMAHVAANGLLVLAPNTGGYDGRGRTCGSSSECKDMILAVTASRDGGAALHPALATANWDRVGMWGYSMGGKTAPRAAAQPGLGVEESSSPRRVLHF